MSLFDRNPAPFLEQSTARTPYAALEFGTFLEVLGPVAGLSVLDVGCGEGRLTRLLADAGARHVTGVDISAAMLARAQERDRNEAAGSGPDRITYRQVSAASRTWRLDAPADVATAMYLFQHAPSEADLARMCRFIARNLVPGGRLVAYGLSPDYDASKAPADMEARLGFHYRALDPEAGRYELAIGGYTAPVHAWSRSVTETCLRDAGFLSVSWHPLGLPSADRRLQAELGWYLANPSCIVLSAQTDPEG